MKKRINVILEEDIYNNFRAYCKSKGIKMSSYLALHAAAASERDKQ